MANIIVPQRRVWTRQPQRPVGVNKLNPIANGLVASFFRPVSDWPILGSGRDTISVVNSGVVSVANGSSSPSKVIPSISRFPMTMLRIGSIGATGNVWSGIRKASSGGSTKAFFSSESGGKNRFWSRSSSSANIREYGVHGDQKTGDIVATCGVFKAYNDIDVYWNGELDNGTLTVGDTTNNTLETVGIHTPDVSTYSTSGTKVLAFLIWNRALSACEVKIISANPWQIFASRDRRTIIDLGASGGTLNASASGSDTASGSATLEAQVALAAVGVALAGGSATAGVSVPLSAAGISVAGGSANATATVTITAAGLAQAAGSAGLSAAVLLAGAGAAQASGNATLAALLNALASGAAQASGSANLSGGAPGALSAAGAAQASGQAVLSVTVQLAATGGAQASGSATGNASAPGQIAASGSAQASGTATVNVTVQLTAAGFVQAMGAGQFSAQIPLQAVGQAMASGSAALAISNGSTLAPGPERYRLRAPARLARVVASRNYTVKK